jgi:threonine/homoserine/homoserine lactone efflux protein
MTIAEALALLLIMGALAAIPSSSVALVVARSASRDIRNGLAASAGIVVGDLIFVLMAAAGMTVLAEQAGAFFTLVRYLAAAYLIWFGIGLIRNHSRKNSNSRQRTDAPVRGNGLATSFATGLLLTMGDIKAIFFYASLLPTFLDLGSLTGGDILAVSVITIIAVGGVKATYALAARKLASVTRGLPHERGLKIVSGGLLVGAGGYLIFKP